MKIFVQDCTELYNPVVTTISASDARATLPELLSRVDEGEEITITRHGRAVAVLVRPDALRSRRIGPLLDKAEDLDRQLAQARAKPLPQDGLSSQRGEELVRDTRRNRDHR
jgi:antitoxin (DNA-binding transcriptional repressor) of toxin-antitoxin stability system